MYHCSHRLLREMHSSSSGATQLSLSRSSSSTVSSYRTSDRPLMMGVDDAIDDAGVAVVGVADGNGVDDAMATLCQ